MDLSWTFQIERRVIGLPSNRNQTDLIVTLVAQSSEGERASQTHVSRFRRAGSFAVTGSMSLDGQ